MVCELVSEVRRVVFRGRTIYFQRFGELVLVVGRVCVRGGMRCLYGLVESSEGVECVVLGAGTSCYQKWGKLFPFKFTLGE